MVAKKYTLYFKGKDKNNRNQNYPIISLNLKDMDAYTSCYKNHEDFFNNLPNEVSDFIKKELGYGVDFNSNKSLEEHMYITDNDIIPIMDVIFSLDADALYVEPKELENVIIKKLMTIKDYQRSLLKTNTSLELKKKLDFFTYLYNNFVKGKKIECMIDDYDVKRCSFNYDEDKIMIASLATNKDNLVVLCKKIAQTLESRRMLALEFKKIFKDEHVIPMEVINKRKNVISLSLVSLGCIESLRNFKNMYYR